MGKSAEERLESRRVRDLQKIIVKLKRELAQSNKARVDLERELEARTDEDEDDEDDEDDQPAFRPSQKTNYCPKCGASPIVMFVLRGFPYFKCEANGCKGRIK